MKKDRRKTSIGCTKEVTENPLIDLKNIPFTLVFGFWSGTSFLNFSAHLKTLVLHETSRFSFTI